MSHPERRRLTAVLGLAALLVNSIAFAHEAQDQAVPQEVGIKVSAAVALVGVRASAPLPAASLPGVLGAGDAPQDQRDHALEHATLQIGARWHAAWSAAAAWGWHGSEPAHAEAAWLQWQHDEHLLRLGRQSVERGAVITEAGHFDRFLQAPLAVRAVFGGSWQDDGLQWRWTSADQGMVRALGLGIWRNRAFPGATGSPASLHVHPQFEFGNVTLDAFVAHASVHQRGQSLQASTGTHTHDAPDCTRSLTQVACFDGQATLAGLSTRWNPAHGPWTFEGAWLIRRERGYLVTSNGDTQYRGKTQGGWVDLRWQASPAWQTALRLERLAPRHSLTGIGASLVATDTGLDATQASHRATLMLGWQFHPSAQLTGETGRERLGRETRNFGALRVLWRASLPPAL